MGQTTRERYLDDGQRLWLMGEPLITVDATFTGQITVAAAATPVAGPDIDQAGSGFLLKAHPANTEAVWFMATGRGKANGYPLNPGEQALAAVQNLSMLDFGADVDGEKICWMKI